MVDKKMRTNQKTSTFRQNSKIATNTDSHKTARISGQSPALKVPNVPLFILNSFWEKKILKTCTLWTISMCKILSPTKLL